MPMRINRLSSAVNAQTVEAVKTPSTKSFEENFVKAEGKIHLDKISDLLSRIDEIGKDLKSKPGLEPLIKYRKLVKDFLTEVLKGYECQQNESFDFRGRRKIYTTINKVQKNVDELVSKFIENQSDNINIAKEIDDIRGMLVDLYT